MSRCLPEDETHVQKTNWKT